MAAAPTPCIPPGDFFVVTYERETQAYTLHVDDGAESSYRLGSLQQAMRYFDIAGLQNLGYRAIDLAREFSAAQVVPKQKRVFQIGAALQCNVSGLFDTAENRPTYLPPYEQRDT